jgi:hypothetical protein
MKHITRQTLPGIRKAPLFILALIVLLLSASCYSPLTKEDGDMSLNISMSRGITGPTDILAGLLVPSDFEETLKEITRLTAAIVDLSEPEASTAEDDLTDLLIELALGGTINFGGSPYFIVEIPNVPDDPEYCTVSGIPSERDYFLYMGSFEDVAELEMFFGLKDEDTGFNADLIPFTNLFYVEALGDSNYHGVTVTINNSSSIFDVPGWYFLDVWTDNGDSAVLANIVAKASQPFRVETGKSTAVEVHLVKAP